MKNELYDQGDFCLRTSLYMLGDAQPSITHEDAIRSMRAECRSESLFPRKSEAYKWSNSGSENVSDNTLFKRPTYWIWKNILRHFNLDFYKGLSTDQYRPYFVYLYMSKDRTRALRIFLNYILRLGFAPSFMEWAPLKPQAYIMLLATIWEPLKYLVWLPFKLGAAKELSIACELGTTNKISLLPTLSALRLPLPPISYIKRVYNIYWPQDDIVKRALIGRFNKVEG